MKHIKRFEAIDHSGEDPFGEETWRDPIEKPMILEPIATEHEATAEEFNDYLNDTWPPYIIGAEEFRASDVLKTMHPYAYEIMFGEYQDEENQEMWQCPICDQELGDYRSAKFHCQKPLKRPKEDKYRQYAHW